MKNIKSKFAILLATLLFFTSCLEEKPRYSLSTTLVFSTDEEAAMALNGCYGQYIGWSLYGQQLIELLEASSGVMWGNVTPGTDIYNQNTLIYPNTLSAPATVWSTFYTAIAHVNAYIYGAESGSLSESFRTKSLGEAYFLRGLAYYHLGLLFEKAPILTQSASSNNYANPAQDRTQVQKQAAADFLKAESMLTLKGANPSIPCKYACYAMLAKLYYYSGDLATAKTYATKLYGKYSLAPYRDLFTPSLKGTPEDIMTFNSTINYPEGVGSRLNWVFAPQNSVKAPALNWHRYSPSKPFIDYFIARHPKDARFEYAFFMDSVWLAKPATPRWQACYPYGIDHSVCADPSNPQKSEIPTAVKVVGGTAINFNPWSYYTTNSGYHYGWCGLKKYFDPNQGAQITDQSFRVVRYADILLMLADIENEIGDRNVALSYLNEFFTFRRGAKSEPRNWTLDEVTRENIYHERLFELVGEGHNYFDTRRWGAEFMKREIVDRHDRHAITIEHASKANINWGSRLFKNASIEWGQLYFKVPKREIDANPNIF